MQSWDVIDAGVLAARRLSGSGATRSAHGGVLPGAPPAINGLTSIQLGDLIFIPVQRPVSWDMR